MPGIGPDAQSLNSIIQDQIPALFRLLSVRGRRIYFPQNGPVVQGAQAKGKKINATIGMAFEDDMSPMRLHSISNAIDVAPMQAFPYAPAYGIPKLRQAWSDLLRKKNPSLNCETSLPIVTNGLTHALSVAGYMFLDPGDTVLMTDMFWGNYRIIFEYGYDAQLAHFNTFKNGGLDVDAMAEALRNGKGKKILLLNFPHNPTGYTPTVTEMDGIVDAIDQVAKKGEDILVILDDAYFGLSFLPGLYAESPFARLADLHENVVAIKIDGATKEDYVWGFRTGFLTYGVKGLTSEAGKAIATKTGGMIRGNISNASHLSQSLLLGAIQSENYQKEKEEKFDLLKSRFDKVRNIFENQGEQYAEYFQPLPYNSGYFMCIQLSDGLDGEAIRKTLLDKYDTGVIAMKNVLRIAYSSVAAHAIPTLFDNIYNACKNYRG